MIDEKYYNKYPNTYQALNVIRDSHYQLFKEDLSFNGDNKLKFFGCMETDIYAFFHTCKHFGKVGDKKKLLTIALESGNLKSKDKYCYFSLNQKVFTEDNEELILKFLKNCFEHITTRIFNTVLTRNEEIYFIYIPFDKPTQH